jgi:hypothetical protein
MNTAECAYCGRSFASIGQFDRGSTHGWMDCAERTVRLMRAALEEIANDPTGMSSYQADLAKQALDGTYEPFAPPPNAMTDGE